MACRDSKKESKVEEGSPREHRLMPQKQNGHKAAKEGCKGDGMEKASVPEGVLIGNMEAKGENISIGKNRTDKRRRVEAYWKIGRRKNPYGGNGYKGMGDDGRHSLT